MIARVLAILAVLQALLPLLTRLGTEARDLYRAGRDAWADKRSTNKEWQTLRTEFAEARQALGDAVAAALRTYGQQLTNNKPNP